MSIILRTLQDKQNVDTTGKTTAVVSFEPKWIDAHHDGHIALIQHAKSLADIVFVNYWYSYSLMDFFFGDITSFYRESSFSNTPNEQYMIDWCELQGVDYIWFPTKDSDLFQKYNMNDVKSWAYDICIIEGYIHSDIEVMRHIQRIMMTLKPLIDNKYYHYDYRVTSWKDGTIRFFEKHFYEKYLGTNVIILDPVLSTNGLPLLSSNRFLKSDIEKIAQVNTHILKKNNIDIVKNPEKFKNEIRDFTDLLSDDNVIIRAEKINVVNMPKFLPLNKIIIDITTNINTSSTHTWNILK